MFFHVYRYENCSRLHHIAGCSPSYRSIPGSRSDTQHFRDDMAAPVPQVMDQKAGILGWKLEMTFRESQWVRHETVISLYVYIYIYMICLYIYKYIYSSYIYNICVRVFWFEYLNTLYVYFIYCIKYCILSMDPNTSREEYCEPPHHSPNAPSEGTAGSIGIIHAWLSTMWVYKSKLRQSGEHCEHMWTPISSNIPMSGSSTFSHHYSTDGFPQKR